MAGKFEEFNSLVEEFNKNHGVNFSFERYEIKLKQTLHMRSFFTGGGKISAEDFAYRTVAKELFRETVESMIAKKVNSVDHTIFLDDFDKLMDNYREYCNRTGDKTPGKNGGWGKNVEMINDMQGKINDIPADKSDFIKNRYIKRSVRLRDMRADIEGMGKEKPITAEELSRAIVYARALEKTVNERSGWWRAFHRIQGPAEKRDLKVLNAFIDKYRDSDIYEKAEAFANENAVGEVNSKFEAAKEEIKAKELLRPRRLKEQKQAHERMANPKVYDHVSKQVFGILNESLPNDAGKDSITKVIHSRSKDIIRTMWGAFEKATTADAKENAIIKHTQELFNENHKWLNGLKFKDEAMIVANQRITDLMLKQYSPATSDSKYDKFCNKYLVSDERFMEGFIKEKLGITEIKKDELTVFVNDLKAELEDKRKIKIPDNDLNAKNVETSKKQTESLAIDSRAKTH